MLWKKLSLGDQLCRRLRLNRMAGGGVGLVVVQDRVADHDALVTDVGAGVSIGDELCDLVLAFMAERAAKPFA